MSDLIRRSDALKAIANDGDEHWWYEERINEVPAVDAVEVVHAKWEEGVWTGEISCYYMNRNGGDRRHLCEHTPLNCEFCHMNEVKHKRANKCPVCGKQVRVKTNYCPNCGARMDGE